jgi:hypothetical protein
MTYSPALHVAATPELLEAILERVDIRTIITSAQRVCKDWHILVALSIPLRQALFLHPILPTCEKDIINERTLNPLLVKMFPSFFRDLPAHSNGCSFSDLMMRFQDSPFDFMDDTSDVSQPYSSIKDSRRAAFLRKSASWRRMLLQQPSCPKIGIIDLLECRYYTGVLSAPGGTGGLTMGTLYDLVYKYVGNPSVDAQFFVHWRDNLSRNTGARYELYEEPMGSTNLLRDFDTDVGVVLLLETKPYPWDYRSTYQPVLQTITIHELESRFRPEGMEMYKVDMTFRFREDDPDEVGCSFDPND